MILAAGTRLGPYEIVAPLGAGGMGEVYRARDPRLGRDVAIKALPAEFALDPERIARFEREAKLLASLSHPNIAGIFGLEEVEGARYLVLELIEGESLAQRLMRGAMPLEEALEVAKQIAAGIEAAHENGVVHRDLKPGNVMVTPAGGVKVLDFGLAKAGGTDSATSSPHLSASPTMSYARTQAGVILGTAAYMSPEQTRGRVVDRRTDIWSFGCLLYEMLTGQRAYDGDTVSDMVARILEREPDWSALPATTPPRLVSLLKRCLTKDAKKRQRDMGDVRIELEALAHGDLETASETVTTTAARTGLPRWAPALGAAALLAIGALGAMLLRPHNDGLQARTLTLLAPPSVSFGRATTDVVLSPDGRLIVYVASDTVSGPRLWVRSIDRENSRALDGTENANGPFWAPDNRRVGFFAGGKLMTVNVVSGSVRTLASAPLDRGGAWGRGVILYQPRSLGPLWSISEAGGEPTVATEVDSAAKKIGHRFPQFLPDGRHFVLTVLGDKVDEIAVGALGTRTVRTLFQTSAGSGATWAAPGWLIAARDGAVKAQRFDPRTLRTSGPAIEVPGLRAVSPYSDGAPILSASSEGTLVQRSALDLPSRLAIVDRQGRTIGDVSGPDGIYFRGSMFPDGRHAVFEYAHTGGDSQLWLSDLVRGTMQPLTFDGSNYAPMVSPDGQEIAFTREFQGSQQDLWTLHVNLPGSQKLVARLPNRFNTVLCWSADGHGVLIRSQGTDTQQDLQLVTLGDSARVRPLLATRFNEPTGAISLDGKWLAYISDESGSYECRVRPFPAVEGPVQVVSRGAWTDPNASGRIGEPVWRRDGRELMYAAADGRTLMSVTVTPGNPPTFGEPRRMFRLSSAVTDMVASPDLDRFILSITRDEEGRPTATVILNWPRLLENAK